MSPTQTFQHRRQTLRQRGTCDRTAHSRYSLHDFSAMVIDSAVDTRTAFSELFKTEDKRHHPHHHHHLPPWIRSFDQFRHRRIAIVSWGVHGLFFLEVCRWGRVSAVWCCPFFRGGWSSFVCVWVSRLVFHRSLVLSLWLRFLFYQVLCIP